MRCIIKILCLLSMLSFSACESPKKKYYKKIEARKELYQKYYLGRNFRPRCSFCGKRLVM